jgi:hypothetical protein
MSEQDNLQLANEAIAAINAHDIDGYVNFSMMLTSENRR